MRDPWEEFRRGALTATRASLIGTLVVAALWFVAGSVVVTPRYLAAHGGPVLRRGEAGARATGDALALRYDESRTPTVVIVGASDLRQATTAPARIAADLTRRLERRIAVVDLTVAGLLIWEAAALADHVPQGMHGVLVLGVGPGLLAHARRDLEHRLDAVRFGLDSEILRDEIRKAGIEAPRRTGIYFLDHLAFLASLRPTWPRLLPGAFTPERHDHLLRERLTGEARRRRAERVRARLDDYAERRDECLGVLGRIVDRTRRRGNVEVLLVDGPRDASWTGEAYPPEVMHDYARRIREFARERDLAVVDLATEAALRPDDFADECHVRRLEAVERCTARVQAHLATLLSLVIEREGSR